MTLHQAACEACDACGGQKLGPLLATASVDAAELEHMPMSHQWQPGRCSFSLLPLRRLPSARTTSWEAHDAECLVSTGFVSCLEM